MTGGLKLAPEEHERQRSLVSEIVHNLSQPITVLHCSLDLALHRDRTVKQFRRSIGTALQSAECLRQRLLLVKVLQEAGDPTDSSQWTDIARLLSELREDFLPLFESAGQAFTLKCSLATVLVRADPTRLQRALFCFIEYLFRHSDSGAVLAMQLRTMDGQVELQITSHSSLPVRSDEAGTVTPTWAVEIEIACRTFLAADGAFNLEIFEADRNVWRAKLPLEER